MLLTYSSITKGIPSVITLNKTELFSLPAISSDAYFSYQSNVKTALFIYDSNPGNQKEILRFNLSEAFPSDSFEVSAYSRNSFELVKIILEDHDGGSLTIQGGLLPAGLNILVNNVAPTVITPSVDYAGPYVFTKDELISQISPISLNAVSFSVSPSLPLGLTLNTSSGVISGTSSVVSSETLYTITATSSTGHTASDQIQLTVNDVAPSQLSYSLGSAVYTKGSTITANSPAYSGGLITSWSISPSLPAGLLFNTLTGIISGTASVLQSSVSYTITGTNSGGSTSAVVSIVINDVAPSALTYSTLTASYTVGTAITANSPSSSGGAVTSYSVSPALPAGLSLNTFTGVISGTPTATAAQGSYTVTATNSGGLTTRVLTITVQAVAVTTTLSLASVDPNSIPGNQPFIPQVIRVTFSEPVKVNSNFYTKIMHLGVARYTTVGVPGFYYTGPIANVGDEQIYTSGNFRTNPQQSEANAINFNSFYSEITILPITKQNDADGVIDQTFNLLAGVGATADGRLTQASNTVLVDVIGDNNS